jgi:hypothetical protein
VRFIDTACEALTASLALPDAPSLSCPFDAPTLAPKLTVIESSYIGGSVSGTAVTLQTTLPVSPATAPVVTPSAPFFS